MFRMIGKGFISGVILSVVVHPKPYEIFSVTELATPLGISFLLGFGCMIGLIFSLLICVYVSHLVVGLVIGIPLK